MQCQTLVGEPGARSLSGSCESLLLECARLGDEAERVGSGAPAFTELSLDDYAGLASELVAAAAGRPVIVQPNAGSPRLVDGKICYDESAAQFAAAAPRFLAAGARLVGGCCGSTPEHIAAMRALFPR